MLKQAQKSAQRMAKEHRPWATGLTKLITVQISAARGRDQQAAEEFREAELVLESADMALHAAAARYGRGIILGGTEGASLIADAHSFLTHQDVKKPDAFLGIFVPWMAARRRVKSSEA